MNKIFISQWSQLKININALDNKIPKFLYGFGAFSGSMKSFLLKFTQSNHRSREPHSFDSL